MNKVMRFQENILQITKNDNHPLVNIRISEQDRDSSGNKYDVHVMNAKFPKDKLIKFLQELIDELEEIVKEPQKTPYNETTWYNYRA